MYTFLLALHSLFRWLVLISLIYSIYRAYMGYTRKDTFTKSDNAWRHWTATIAHTQLIIGIILYIKSPIVQYYWSTHDSSTVFEVFFFSIIHFILMLVSVVIVTIGSAKAKRKTTDSDKYKTMLVWFVVTLIIILIAIPWPFSPLSARPYFRPF